VRAPAGTGPGAVTTTDLLKSAGLTLVLIDHIGAYFVEDETGWRLLGRLAAPIFFFLIGFARSRTVPWTWPAFGTVLTVTDWFEVGSLSETTLNILLSFALLRRGLLPAFERWVLPSPLRSAGLVALCVGLIPWTDHVLEYGTGGWLWALFGLAHRRWLEHPDGARFWTRTGVAAVIATAYALRESDHFAFSPEHTALLMALTAGLVLLLARFRRADLAEMPPRAIAVPLRLCGRYSLEIYAVSLFAMQVVAYGMDAGDQDDGAP